jgi:Tol biopolymer transport system component
MLQRIAVIMCVLLGITAASAFASTAPTGGILYVGLDKSGRTSLQIYSLTDDKSVTISADDSGIMYPKASADGEMVGYTKKGEEMKSEVYLMYPKQKKVEKILDNAAFEGFSPSGKYLLYTSCDETGGLYVYDIQKKNAKLVSRDRVFSAAWANDSKWIAASVISEGGKSDLIRINLGDFKAQKLTSTPAINEAFPLFTADGRYLVFFMGKERNTRIAYYDIAAGAITETAIEGRNPSMSPDNFWVVYEKNDHIYVSDKDGKSTRKLSAGKTPVWIH